MQDDYCYLTAAYAGSRPVLLKVGRHTSILPGATRGLPCGCESSETLLLRASWVLAAGST